MACAWLSARALTSKRDRLLRRRTDASCADGKLSLLVLIAVVAVALVVVVLQGNGGAWACAKARRVIVNFSLQCNGFVDCFSSRGDRRMVVVVVAVVVVVVVGVVLGVVVVCAACLGDRRSVDLV